MNELVASMAVGDPQLGYYNSTTTIQGTTQACGHEVASWNWCYQPLTYSYQCHDKTKAAFAIAKKLIVTKLAKADTVEKFCKLVEMIEAEL